MDTSPTPPPNTGMMDTATAVAAAAVVVALVAVIISAVLAARQLKLLRKANHVPAIIQLLSVYRSVQFHDEHQYVVEHLRRRHDPSLGVYGLPEDARAALLSIAYYYQTFATLIGFKIYDEDRMIDLLRIRSISVWEAIEPYVVQERERNPVLAPAFLALLEDFVDRARGKIAESVQEVFRQKNQDADRTRRALTNPTETSGQGLTPS